MAESRLRAGARTAFAGSERLTAPDSLPNLIVHREIQVDQDVGATSHLYQRTTLGGASRIWFNQTKGEQSSMSKSMLIALGVFLTAGTLHVAHASEDFYGIIESRPDGKVGTWIVGGRAIEVTDKTELDEDHGPLRVGACVEVDMDDGVVEEIESESPQKCGL